MQRWLAWTFAAVVGLLILVAVTSAANPTSIPLRAGRTDRFELIKLVSLIALVGVLAALAFTLLLHRILSARNGELSLQYTLLRALPVTAAALAMIALMTIAGVQLDTSDPRVVLERIIGTGPRQSEPLGIRDQRAPPVILGDGGPAATDTVFIEAQPRAPGSPVYGGMALIIIAAALLAVLAMWWRARRSALRAGRDVTAAEEVAVHGAVVSTIDEMLNDPDPNTAIIGAYARLTESLAACGLGRLDHEAPMEHLRRVLTRVNVRPEPLRRLIHLFEIARFSTHALTSAHREQALAALHAVAAELDTIAPQHAVSAQTAAVP